MDLTHVKTPTGKTFADFSVPPELLKKDPELVRLILESNAMSDAERQYWFNLTLVMQKEQVIKLKNILLQEKSIPVPAKPVTAKEAQEQADKRLAAQEKLREAEKKQESDASLDMDAWG